MIKGSQNRNVGHGTEVLFADRWSPRAMSGESIPTNELMTLFEAARWAPSANNNQPWRILYAQRDGEHWQQFLNFLVESNQVWARHAAALLVLISKRNFDHNGKPSITHSFDTGAAWENLALQGSLKGYVIHGMQGFNYEAARSELNIPDDFQVEAMVAVGRPGSLDALPEALQKREFPSDRKPLSRIVSEGSFHPELA